MSNSAENAWCATTGAAASSSTTPTVATARLVRMKVSLLLGFLFRRLFGGALLLRASTGERIVQTVVPFVTRVLEYRTFIPRPRHFRGPGSRPRRRIVDRELIAKRIFGRAREAL